ncbi:OmpA family protein [Roseomonas sp. CCTCC AB2023176]|uniref:OmpA family protein n=1 Tax=Roseomonas sp. CCTCC AB2023176 TaxID=3342640 RepID=UPI0035D9A531
MRFLSFAIALLAAGPAAAQGTPPRPAPGPALPPFQCVGAEALEEDVFEVPFTAASDRVGDAARTPLALAVELLKREPDRNACILGHANREGGQQTSVNLAARRARAVRDALQRAGIPEARLRSEARVAGFSRTTGNAVARSVSVVIMPVSAPRPERVAPEPAARPAEPANRPAAPIPPTEVAPRPAAPPPEPTSRPEPGAASPPGPAPTPAQPAPAVPDPAREDAEAHGAAPAAGGNPPAPAPTNR